LADTAVNAVEPAERLGLIARDIDPSYASNKRVLNSRNRLHRGEALDRQWCGCG
jgi:hypothetical protein